MCHASHIMVIDDDFDNFLILSDLFKDISYNGSFLFVDNELRAIEYLEEVGATCIPCLIILDIWMPIINGVDFLSYLKSSEKLRNIPVIVYTSVDDQEQRDRCMQLGAAEFLIKPYSIEEGKLVASHFLSFLPQ